MKYVCVLIVCLMASVCCATYSDSGHPRESVFDQAVQNTCWKYGIAGFLAVGFFSGAGVATYQVIEACQQFAPVCPDPATSFGGVVCLGLGSFMIKKILDMRRARASSVIRV